MPWESVLICDLCWLVKEGNRAPVRMSNINAPCAICGEATVSGIFVRLELVSPYEELSEARRALTRSGIGCFGEDRKILTLEQRIEMLIESLY